MKKIVKEIECELKYLGDIERQVENTLKQGIEGRLRCTMNKGNYQYYNGQKYIQKNERQYAVQLAQRDYCLKLQEGIKEYQQLLLKLQTFCESEKLENIYRDLHAARKALVTPLVVPTEEMIENFEHIDYEKLKFAEDNITEYYTVNGERVRSKSEKIIADELLRFRIPYKYELPITLQEYNRTVILHPDFTVLNRSTGKRWIIEHLGMMDDENYYENAMKKLEVYEKNDILLGRDLILFHETSASPLNTKVVTRYIAEYLV